MTFLEKILSAKRGEVTARQRTVPVEMLKAQPLYREPRRPFAAAFAAGGFGIIAELKKASPSRGLLREHFDPAALARSYTEGGAAALSVLTDEEFFQGRIDFLPLVRKASGLPILRKDFIISPYQIHEARAAGADAILLIVAALARKELDALAAEAASATMGILVEVHDETELSAALELGTGIIGVNNRDLRSFSTDIAVSLRLAQHIPPDRAAVTESGITSAADLQRMREAGYRGALIGETFMKEEDPGLKLREMLESLRQGVL